MINEDDLNEKQVRKMLKTYVATGENTTIEKAIKGYYLDCLELIICFDRIVDIEMLGGLVSIQNIIIDSPFFTFSKKYLENTKKDLDKIRKDISIQLSDKQKNSYFKKEKVDGYYSDLYNDLTSQFNYFGSAKEYNEEIDKLIILIDKIDNILSFLSNDYDKWKIINGNIVFETKELSDEFNLLLIDVSRYDNGEKM